MCVVCRSSSGQYSEGRGSQWSGELSKNSLGFGYSEKQVTIAVDSAGAVAGSKAAEVKPVKEVPLWLSHSTVDTADYADRQLQQLQVQPTFSLLLFTVCVLLTFSTHFDCSSLKPFLIAHHH